MIVIVALPDFCGALLQEPFADPLRQFTEAIRPVLVFDDGAHPRIQASVPKR